MQGGASEGERERGVRWSEKEIEEGRFGGGREGEKEEEERSREEECDTALIGLMCIYCARGDTVGDNALRFHFLRRCAVGSLPLCFQQKVHGSVGTVRRVRFLQHKCYEQRHGGDGNGKQRVTICRRADQYDDELANENDQRPVKRDERGTRKRMNDGEKGSWRESRRRRDSKVGVGVGVNRATRV